MRELLDYPAANGFSTWIVSGVVVAFMRTFAEDVYGIPPERVIGSSIKMLEWTTSASGPRLGVIVHHDDAAREFVYDRCSRIGRLERGPDEPGKRGWSLVSVKNDWKAVYTPQK